MKRRLPLLLGLALVPAHLACGKRPQTATPSPPTPTASATAPAANPSGPRQKTLLRGAAVMTATGKIYERADVLLEGDQIVAVGPDLAAPADAKIVDNLESLVISTPRPKDAAATPPHRAAPRGTPPRQRAPAPPSAPARRGA